MGLSYSPHALQRLLEELLQPIQHASPLFWIHIDDIILASPPHRIDALKRQLLDTLETAGFHVNSAKSQLEPTSRISYLGLDIDFSKRT